jgi:hypothetical protein
MRRCAIVLVFLGLTTGCLAADIKPGATVQVKPNSIWFDEADQLAKWHALKKNGDAAALAAYEDQQLHQRNAWQLINPLSATVLDYDAKNAEVHVRMLSEGRFKGTEFYLDPDAIAP